MRRITWCSLIALLIFELFTPKPASAFEVTSVADGVDAAPGDGICATARGDCTLRAAVQEANALAGSDIIQLPDGSYLFSVAGAGENAAASGDLDILSELTIQGSGMATTVVDAQQLDRVFDVPPGSTISLTIRDLTIRGGEVTDVPGAGLRDETNAPILLERVRVSDNHVLGTTSSAIGGGIHSGGLGTLTVRGSMIDLDSADRGGALFNNSTLVIEDSIIATNTARAGSAIANFGTVSVDGVLFFDNSTSNNAVISVSGPVSLVNSTLSGNSDPLAIFVVGGSTLSLQNVTVFDNSTPRSAWIVDGGVLEFVNSVLSNPATYLECDIVNASVNSLGHSLDSDGSCVGGGTGDLPSTAPGLGPLADNGGTPMTLSHLPLVGSPLIDAGDNLDCPLVDQRGEARPADGDGNGSAVCDIGAVEVVPESEVGAGVAFGACALAWLSGCRRNRLGQRAA